VWATSLWRASADWTHGALTQGSRSRPGFEFHPPTAWSSPEIRKSSTSEKDFMISLRFVTVRGRYKEIKLKESRCLNPHVIQSVRKSVYSRYVVASLQHAEIGNVVIFCLAW
jgi:hypothetical protein